MVTSLSCPHSRVMLSAEPKHNSGIRLRSRGAAIIAWIRRGFPRLQEHFVGASVRSAHAAARHLRSRLRRCAPALRTAALVLKTCARRYKPTVRWQQMLLKLPYVLVALILIQVISGPNMVQGAYTTSSLDADGNNHLGSNTVNKTVLYDASKDSSAATQQQLGVDRTGRMG